MANTSQFVLLSNRSKSTNLRITAALVTGLILITAVWASSAQGQAPQTYSQMQILDKFLLEPDDPRLVEDRKGELHYEALSEDEKKRVKRDNREITRNISAASQEVNQILEGSGNLDAPIMQEFFVGYLFAEMTQTDERILSKLGTLRQQFFKKHLSRKVTGSQRTKFIQNIILPNMLKIAGNQDYHPAARLNAVYIIGLLDSQAANRIDNQRPIPSASAMTELLKILNSNQSTTYLKIASLVGIERHLIIKQATGRNLDASQQQQISKFSMDALNSQPNGQDNLDPDAAYWLKRRSVQMLGLLKNPASTETLLSIIEDQESSIWLQYDALQAIGQIDHSSTTSDQAKKITSSIADLLSRVIHSEATTINAAVEKLIYENMLYGNNDLEATGTDYDKEIKVRAAGRNRPAGGGGEKAGEDDKGGGVNNAFGGGGLGNAFGGGGLGNAFGGGGLKGGGRKAGGNRRNDQENKIVELPNYMLNLTRRRVIAFAHTGKKTLRGNSSGIYQAADQTTQTFIDGITKDLDKVAREINLGLTHLNDKNARPEETPEEGITKTLSKICTDSAASLSRRVANQQGVDDSTSPASAETDETQPDFGG